MDAVFDTDAPPPDGRGRHPDAKALPASASPATTNASSSASDGSIPGTLVVPIIGRLLAYIVDCPTPRLAKYVVADVNQDEYGLSIRLAVPGMPPGTTSKINRANAAR